MTSAKSYAAAVAETSITDPTGATETTRLLENDGPELVDSSASVKSAGEWDGYKDFEGLPWWKRPSVFWLLGPFGIFTLAFGGVLVPRLNLILDLVCKKYFADRQTQNPDLIFNPVLLGTDNPQCKIPEVMRSVATFMLVLSFVTGLLSAIIAPKLGHLSDRYGRTRLLAFASVGGVCNEIMTILAARYPDVIDYRWLILGGVFDGLTGSFTAGNIMSQSYTSDCTPPSQRATWMGFLHACLFSGLAFGPLLAGYFVKWTGSLLSIFYVVVGCHIAFILFIWFVVPESLSKRKQMAAREKWQQEKDKAARFHGTRTWIGALRAANPFAPLKVLWPTGPGTSPALRRNLLALAIDDAIILGSSLSVGAVIILYCESTFGWGNLESSQYVSAMSLIRVVVLLGVFPVINYFGRVRPAAKLRRDSGVAPTEKNKGADMLDIWVLRVALMSDVAGSVGYTLARSQGYFVASGMVTALGGLGSATTQAIISKHVPSERVGQLLGAIGMLQALTRVFGPVLFNGLFAATVGHFSQAVFVLLAGFFGFALCFSFTVRPHVHWEENTQDEQEPFIPGLDNNRSSDSVPIDEEDQFRFT